MKSALILFLLSFSLLHGRGDEHLFIDPVDENDNNLNWNPAEIHFINHFSSDRRYRRQIDGNNPILQIISGNDQINVQLEPWPAPIDSITIREGDESYEIPVEKSQPCHWKGWVEGGGHAALSTCQNQDQISGTIMTSEGLWIIRPNSESNSVDANRRLKKRSNNIRLAASHLILSPETTAATLMSASRESDVVKVPIIELEAAAKLAAEDALQRKNDAELYQDSDSDNFEYFSESNDDVVYSYFPNWLDYNYDTGSFFNFNALNNAFYALFGLNNGDLFEPQAPVILERRNENSQQNIIHLLERKGRSGENKKWVEMALFADESMYKRMETKFPNETINKIKDYATTLVHTMDLLYGDKSLGVDIGFRLVHLEVMKKPPKGLDSSGGKAKAYLTSFCKYAGDQNVNSGLWDHALLISGTDIHEQGLKSTAGLAWAGTMCYRYYSCSIAEGNSLGAAFIVTHEIGHSLGMEHDGAGVSEECDRDKYLMSPTTGPGKVTWSNCSTKNLQDFIEYGTSELRSKKYQSQLLSKPTCLSEIVSKTNTSSTKKKLPGEMYDAYFQCSLGLGTKFKPYFQRNKPPFNNICWILYCGNGTHAVSLHPALDGTKCDKNKYCRGGSCVKRPKR